MGVTNPDGNIVTFWNLKSGQFIKALPMPSPRGIALTLDQAEFVISYDGGTQLGRLSASELGEVRSTGRGKPVLSGSHIVIHSLTA